MAPKRTPPPADGRSGTQQLTHNPFAALRGTSSRPNRACERQAPPATRAQAPLGETIFGDVTLPASVALREEPSGHAGRAVTRVMGIPPGLHTRIAQDLKLAFGCGAIQDNEDLVLLASVEMRAAVWFEQKGVTITSTSRPRVSYRPEAPKRVFAADPTSRASLRRGQRVAVVLKADQPTGAETEGEIAEILTPSAQHPRGIKVRLASGQVGRVKKIFD